MNRRAKPNVGFTIACGLTARDGVFPPLEVSILARDLTT